VGPGKVNLEKYRNGAADTKRWDGIWQGLQNIENFTLQPRDWKPEEEAEYEAKFCKLMHDRFPQAQPWIYSECGSYNVLMGSASSLGTIPTSEMTKTEPALSFEEGCSDMMVYAEEVQKKLLGIYKDGKAPKLMPSILMMGWAKNLVDSGKVPGFAPGTFYDRCYQDTTHASTPTISQEGDGAYLVMLVFYGAFYHESSEGKVLPMSTMYTPEQARIFQRLAWDTLVNYPDFGMYQEGTTPVGAPVLSPAPEALSENQVVTLSSSTPGAWYRYTLDGTEPTRTRGYIYCGKITVRPGMTVKAIGYKSGMADSGVTEGSYSKK
jgi:hypothetical protein